MTKKTLKRQRNQRGGNAEDPDDVRKGLDALVTYFLWEIKTKNQNNNEERDFLKYGEYERKKLVDAYYEYGADKDAKVGFDRPTMIAIALLRNHMREDTAFDANKEYGVITIEDLRYNRYKSPGHNRTEELRTAADAFQRKMSSEHSNIFFDGFEHTSRIYKALKPQGQKNFISKLFDKLQKYAEDIPVMKGKILQEYAEDMPVMKAKILQEYAEDMPVMKGKVKDFDGKTYIDIAKRHLIDEPSLLVHLNTFENALWFIILYIFSVVKFSYKDISRGFWGMGRIKLREEEITLFRQDIIIEAENLLNQTLEARKIQEDFRLNQIGKIGGTRKRRMRKRATK